MEKTASNFPPASVCRGKFEASMKWDWICSQGVRPETGLAQEGRFEKARLEL